MFCSFKSAAMRYVMCLYIALSGWRRHHKIVHLLSRRSINTMLMMTTLPAQSCKYSIMKCLMRQPTFVRSRLHLIAQCYQHC